ncbi:glycosyl transferase, group 1 (plasmid) [Gloeothece citriformis PCC 7424]|uniref:Glycosyl transferase, group 1 n=1 Tax=Gloeothece citriformis (strain PCC 7424) TaxID=65393 RepID=B7KM22_GLOC7|nr:glycosyl transferase group 1 [Gloeothece citriformis]ACK73844.1 glycosyl transferase, group 1 [Gloeothece citriformis PCC 7424]
MSAIVACTIITKSYLAYARTLAKSLQKHNPGAILYVLLADRLDNYFNPEDEPFKLIQLEELNQQDILKNMCFYYTPFELCCALRGMLHEYIWKNTNVDKWIFLDSDILVCHSLEPIFKQLETVSILLCPHSTTAVETKFVKHLELNLLSLGLYNGGFLGLSKTDETRKFISWFKERLQFYGFDDLSENQFVDQLWLNLVPLLFKNVGFLTHPGANLAYWNLYERVIEEDAKRNILVNSQPLLFFHFSHWKITEPHKITTRALIHQYDPILMYEGKECLPLSRLGENYREQLINNGYEITQKYPYSFGNFDTGQSITKLIRRKYFNRLMNNQINTQAPFKNYAYITEGLGKREIKLILRTSGQYIIRKIKKILN